MNRRIVFVILFGLVFIGAAALGILSLTRTAPDTKRPAALAENAPPPSPAAAPVVAPPPATAPAPPVAPRPAEPRRRPAPSAEASPARVAAAPATVGPTVHIDSDVPGAQVFVDRNFIGTTPLTTTDITTGSHRLNLSAPGYDGVAQNIEVNPGSQDVVIKLREFKLDLKLEVVHKHRAGSCKGRLVATPQGVRYETTNKDDAFTAPLLELETFEVDYLEKNLRIKPRQGKRYDFTDPEGNADRLFVFHRDVDKARDRLKKGDLPAAQ